MNLNEYVISKKSLKCRNTDNSILFPDIILHDNGFHAMQMQSPPPRPCTYHSTLLPLLSGCASVLKTHSSKLTLAGSSNIKYKYFNVSANQKLSCESL